jgi:hypothetical protein
LTGEDQDTVAPNPDIKVKAHNYAVTFAASDNLTLGVQYSKTDTNQATFEVADDPITSTEDEKITAISAGYNLGGASIALSLVEVENSLGVEGLDYQGAIVTTRFAF